MMEINEKIQQLAQASLTSGSHFLVGVHVAERQNPPKIIVWADGDQGLTIDDCAEISRRLAEKLDQEGIYTSGFTLEVSSPGMFSPFKVEAQFRKNIGREVVIKLKDGLKANGTLMAFDSQVLTLERTERVAKLVGKGKVDQTVQTQIPLEDLSSITLDFKF